MITDSMKIHKGDRIQVISGNDKGRQGTVLASFPRVGKIVVEGLFIRKKHVRPRRQDQKGELVKVPGAFPASRVMLVCPKCSKPVRVGLDISAGRKTRICKKCGGNV